MKRERRGIPVSIRVLGLVVIAGAVGLYVTLPRAGLNNGRIEGSGSIEATQVDIAPKVAGRLVVLRVREGDRVAANQVVGELDHVELDDQVAQARAVLASAQARLAQAQVALSMQQTQAVSSVDQARAAVDATRTRVPQAGEAVALQTSSVAAQVDQARAQVQAASDAVTSAEAALRAAEANIQTVEANLSRAQSDATRADALLRDGAIAAQQVDAARTALAATQAQRDAARAQRDAVRAQVEAARSALKQAQAGLEVALANRRTVPIRQLDVDASRAQVSQAEAALRSAQSATGLVALRAREVEAARAAVEQAQAALRLAETTRGHTVLRSPIAGVIISRSVEVGDLVAVGAPVVTVADLGRPYLRIFVSETDVGRVTLRQLVEVRIDADPKRVFQGTVQEISNRAEFTPGNVQTKEERVKQVFAVKVALTNPEGAYVLKPGLPADAVILTEAAARR